MDDVTLANQGESLKLRSLEKELEDIKQKAKIEYRRGQTLSPIREGGLRPDIFPLIYDKKSEEIEKPNLLQKVSAIPAKPTYLEKENLAFTTKLGRKNEIRQRPVKDKLQAVFWVGIAIMTLSLISLAVSLLV